MLVEDKPGRLILTRAGEAENQPGMALDEKSPAPNEGAGHSQGERRLLLDDSRAVEIRLDGCFRGINSGCLY